MGGIAGFTRFKKPVGNIETLVAMGDAIAHRGPDAHGEYLDDELVGLNSYIALKRLLRAREVGYPFG